MIHSFNDFVEFCLLITIDPSLLLTALNYVLFFSARKFVDLSGFISFAILLSAWTSQISKLCPISVTANVCTLQLCHEVNCTCRNQTNRLQEAHHKTESL